MKFKRPVDVIKALAATTKRLEKEKIIEEAWEDGHYFFFEGVKLCYDRLITFGIKKVPVVSICDEDDFEGDFTFRHFSNLVEKLTKRELTGNAAIDALRDAAMQCNAEEWNLFYVPILKKDLRCGISETTVNKILKRIAKTDKSALDYLVDVFQVQLAQPFDDDKNMSGLKLLDYKFDGARLTTVLDKEANTVTMYTRNGRTNENFKQLIEDMEKLLETLPGSIVLDGEVVAGSFQELMTQMNRKDNVQTDNAKYALFDILPLADFKNKICMKTQKERHEMLADMEGMFQEITDGRIYVLPKMEVNLDTDEGIHAFNEFKKEVLTKIAEAPEGILEGVMIKDAHAPYERKRTKSWLKFKPYVEVTLKIIDIEEGTGKNKNSFGNFVCEGEDIDPVDGQLKKVRVSVGSGYSDALREEIWANKSKYLHRLAEIRADAFSYSRDPGTPWSLRFPRFKGFRDSLSAPGEKI